MNFKLPRCSNRNFRSHLSDYNQKLTMRISSSESAALLFTAGAATALTNRHVTTRSFMGAALLNRQPQTSRSAVGLNGVSMIFEKFFGGGAYNTRIDYESLQHPGPELATLAQNKKVTTHSIRDPNLQLATFGGGCFVSDSILVSSSSPWQDCVAYL
jgi:hypothetical protein